MNRPTVIAALALALASSGCLTYATMSDHPSDKVMTGFFIGELGTAAAYGAGAASSSDTDFLPAFLLSTALVVATDVLIMVITQASMAAAK